MCNLVKKFFRIYAVGALMACSCTAYGTANPSSGFFLPDSVIEFNLKYKTANNNLIVLPFIINDSIKVNLILDTGTRNIVLFGKQFSDQFKTETSRPVHLAGMGTGKPTSGVVSLGNSFVMGSLIGKNVPVVLVRKKSIYFSGCKVDGIIGYDIFSRFEVQVDARQNLITFRSAKIKHIPSNFVQLPIRVEATKPLLDANITMPDGTNLGTALMIDTGADLDVLLKTTNKALISKNESITLGVGLNGSIIGNYIFSQGIKINGYVLSSKLPLGVVYSPWHDYGSLGMNTLKQYIVIINYPGSYICLRKL